MKTKDLPAIRAAVERLIEAGRRVQELGPISASKWNDAVHDLKTLLSGGTMPGTFNVSITVSKTGTEGSHVFDMVDTATGVGYSRTDRFYGQTAASLADLQAVLDAKQKQAVNAAQKKRLPAPTVNGNNLSWTGLSHDEAASVRDHAIEQARGVEKDIAALHPKHVAAAAKGGK